MAEKLEIYFSQFQLNFFAGDHEFPLTFPKRSQLFTTSDLWRKLRQAWTAYSKRDPLNTPYLITAERVVLTVILRDKLVIEERLSGRIALEYLVGGQPKVTSRDLEYCHIYENGALILYNEKGDPTITLSADSHLVESGFDFREFQTAQQLVASVRWALHHVVDEVTKPCRPFVADFD